jgi:hypothetical protein
LSFAEAQPLQFRKQILVLHAERKRAATAAFATRTGGEQQPPAAVAPERVPLVGTPTSADRDGVFGSLGTCAGNSRDRAAKWRRGVVLKIARPFPILTGSQTAGYQWPPAIFRSPCF